MGRGKILIVADPRNSHRGVATLLGTEGWTVREAQFTDYLTRCSLEGPDCVVAVLRNDVDAGHRLLADVHAMDDNLPVILVVSGKVSVEGAVAAMKAGAYEYFILPLDETKFQLSVAHAIRLYHLTKRVFLLENQMGWRGRFDNIIGHSAKMQEIFQLIHTVAKSNATVLITGESGTGKELVARAVHTHSARSRERFVDINCGAIPRDLLENELFGHERGAYTGADRRYLGSCERADRGTLFLDEICEMEPALQVKILRLLQERSFTRVGGTERITSDLRFVAATNRDIQTEVARGAFREDLYYRLNVVPIHLPALRERPEDIPLLAKAFLEKCAAKTEKIFVDFAPEAIEAMVGYVWPGIVRELENVIERIVV
ncbi:MAG: sigma-54-dependent Fis family transcriptional regulator, partial [Deltaproteobacteria bacterium]|nr:sigma-54-dependent Fis family transcriptional regulator [Deltaproteobacteria bacterium]